MIRDYSAISTQGALIYLAMLPASSTVAGTARTHSDFYSDGLRILEGPLLSLRLIACGWSDAVALDVIIVGRYAAGGDGATQANCPQRQAYRVAERRHITIIS
jgi:hypothetical protein